MPATACGVDVSAEFYVQVAPTRDAVAAAQTRWARAPWTATPCASCWGKFVGGLRGIAAEMTLEELHEHRADYAERSARGHRRAAGPQRAGAGGVALVDIDQTSMEFFDPSNAFDAEGLTAP
ncbi:MAG: hypothetical protein R3F55_16375 [Alphaproteobacteria bacterium]